MITIYPTKLVPDPANNKTATIYMFVHPTGAEVLQHNVAAGIPSGSLQSALDENTLTRIHFNHHTSVYFDTPYLHRSKSIRRVKKISAGIFYNDSDMVIVSSKQIPAIAKILADENGQTVDYNLLLLRILHHNAMSYIEFLQQIDHETERLENSMRRRVNNNELFQLMDNQRSLTGIATSLKGLEHLMDRIREHDPSFGSEELLEDTVVAVRQASEMAMLFDADLEALMDAFGSVLSNNVNQIMKILTALTLILAIPTMIAGLFGMNVRLPMADENNAFWIILGIATTLSVLLGVVFYKRRML